MTVAAEEAAVAVAAEIVRARAVVNKFLMPLFNAEWVLLQR